MDESLDWEEEGGLIKFEVCLGGEMVGCGIIWSCHCDLFSFRVLWRSLYGEKII